MELIIDVLILFIVLNCVFKLSLWKLWQQLLFSLLLGGFAWWSVRYAVQQSKTQIADYLQNITAVQSMAILVTIESAVGLAFCLSWLNGRAGRLHRLLYGYASLLMFPAVFYLLTQTIFAATGVDFGLTAKAFAVGIVVLLPVLVQAVGWLVPEKTGRVEIHLLLTIFVCILGLISTEHGRMVYAVKENPIEWSSLGMTFALFLLLAIVGFLFNHFKWYFNR